MEKFLSHTGTAVILPLDNIDTDQIMPKQFLKRIERSGFGQFLFYDWRFNEDGTPKPDFPLNQLKNDGATVLVAGANFGCGSSREHAPWGLADYGFKAIIAESFADIFSGNSYKIGLLPIALEKAQIELLISKIEGRRPVLSIDLEAQRISSENGSEAAFDLDPFAKHCIMNGLDEIGLSLENENEISSYEAAMKNGFAV
ncbi:MAG: 3-isopropylmalate dehydratase small subunit [Pyrinomonadaceae bacterium]